MSALDRAREEAAVALLPFEGIAPVLTPCIRTIGDLGRDVRDVDRALDVARRALHPILAARLSADAVGREAGRRAQLEVSEARYAIDCLADVWKVLP